MKKFALSNLLVLTLALGAVASTGLPAQADAPLVTITGTVVSIEDEVLVVSTDRGNLTFDLDKSTEMPGTSIAVGNRITVWYDSDDKPEDKMDARRIAFAPEPTPVTPVTPAPTTPAPATPPPASAPSYDEPDELPATASPLPLLGGAALLALSASLLLRKRAHR